MPTSAGNDNLTPVQDRVPPHLILDKDADPEAQRGLDASFNKFWAEHDADSQDPDLEDSKARAKDQEKAAKEEAAAEQNDDEGIDQAAARPFAKKAPPKEDKASKPADKAPAEKPKEAPPKEEPQGKGKAEEKPSAAKAEPEKKAEAKVSEDPDAPDDELDSIVLNPNASPPVRKGFQELKTKVKAYKTEARTLKQEVEKRDRELEEIRKASQDVNGLPPHIRRQIEETEQRAKAAEQKARLIDIRLDPDWKKNFDEPVRREFQNFIAEAVRLKGGEHAPEEIKQWGKQMQNLTVDQIDQLDQEWFDRGIIKQFDDDFDRAALLPRAANLLKMKHERGQRLQEFASQPDVFQKLEKERYEQYWGKYINDFKAYSEQVAPKELGNWAVQKEVPKDANAETRKAIERHNANYNKFFEKIKELVSLANDNSETRATSHARLCLTAVKSLKLAEELEEANKALEEVRAERDQLAKENEKVSRARSAVGRSGSGTSSTAKPSRGNGANLMHQTAHEAFAEFARERSR